jgi:Na+/H+ antiporter NhaD/arsenite permease-like protein
MSGEGQAAAPAAMPATAQVVLGCLIFAVVWVLLLKDRWKWLPLGRAMSALAGACAFVAAGVMTAGEAYEAINLPTLALLTGCMLVCAHMEKQGLYAALATTLSSRGSPLSFLARVGVVSGVLSALLTNDTTCIIVTPIVVRACLARRLHPAPYLLVAATCANIGCACSPIGSPQNMIIALFSGITFPQFLGSLGASAALGVVLNIAWIAWLYRREVLHGESHGFFDRLDSKVAAAYGMAPALPATAGTQRGGVAVPMAGAGGGGGGSSRIGTAAVGLLIDSDATRDAADTMFAPVLLTEDAGAAAGTDALRARPSAQVVVLAEPPTAPATPAASEATPAHSAAPAAAAVGAGSEPPGHTGKVHWTPVSAARRKVILAIVAGLPLALLFADQWIGLGWVALLAGAVLCIVDGGPPDEIVARVDGNLLLFFSGLFIVVRGFNLTGVPEQIWGAWAGAVGMHSAAGLAVFAVVVLVGSNTVSNVPLVLLLSPKIIEMGGDATLAWMELSWVSTVAGNLTLLGSVANLIVAERAKDVYPLTFMEYLRAGFPSTIIMCVFGVPLVRACTLLVFGGV